VLLAVTYEPHTILFLIVVLHRHFWVLLSELLLQRLGSVVALTLRLATVVIIKLLFFIQLSQVVLGCPTHLHLCIYQVLLGLMLLIERHLLNLIVLWLLLALHLGSL